MVTLQPATREQGPILANLMQLYMHDWSELTPLQVGEDGRFADYPLSAYWQDDWRHPLLIRADGKLAGFALVAGRSRLTGQAGVFDMAEFFIVRGHRGRGVGQAAARAAFDRFPGRWELRQRDENPAATAFWRKAIERHTQGRFEEVRWDDATWVGPVQRFESVGADCRVPTEA